jgi:formiminotetrahydrofolate cyclodeaminase
MLVKMKINEFVSELASSSPAPGGGTIAAIAGSFAAGLAEMVCNLTIGNSKYPEAQPYLPEVRSQLSEMRDRFLSLADEDTDAFNLLMAAYKLSKETEEDKTMRRKEILVAKIAVTKIPMETTLLAVALLELLPEVITYGNANAISDCGVAMECAHAAGKGALMNVQINLESIKDETVLEELSPIKGDLERRLSSAYKDVVGVFGLKMDIKE